MVCLGAAPLEGVISRDVDIHSHGKCESHA